MGAVRIIVLVVAAIAALGLAFVVRRMASPPRAPAPVAAAPVAAKASVQVLVAQHDLPIGTRISTADLSWEHWPADALNSSFITDGAAAAAAQTSPTAVIGARAASAAEIAFAGGGSAMQAVVGAIVREPIVAKEPIVERKIVRGGEGGYLSVVLQPGMRAVAIPVTVESAAGGFILPGDRVDVMMSRKVDARSAGGGTTQVAVTETVLSNLRVLAIDQQNQPPKNAKSLIGGAATLEVPAINVDTLLRAKTQGDLALALRSYADLGGPSGAPGEQAKAQTVHMFRAGHASEVSAR